MKKYLILLILFVIIFSGCGNEQIENNDSNKENKVDKEEVKNKKIEDNKVSNLENNKKIEMNDNFYENNEYGFSIDFPENWEIKNGDGDVVQEASFENNEINISVDQFNLIEKAVGFSSVKDIMTLEEFVDTIVSGIKEGGFSDVKVMNKSEIKIDGQLAYKLEIFAVLQFLDEKIEMNMLYFISYKENAIYSIECSSDSDDYSKIKPFFLKSIESFKFED
ncbi:MAG: hypothetical protein KAT32_04215 [Candidatus Moranbacteria bacterium]|nr:hypothetical protein [Candidatus Moranbacteria bacterium]